MPIQFFSIRAIGDNETEQKELNAFLNQHRVSSIQIEFVVDGANSFWAIAVEYLSGNRAASFASNRKSQIDYKELLSPEDFAIYSRLRETRKLVAEREGVPVYTIFTNQQLADMATSRINSESQMAKIKGVGKSRIEKYAAEFIASLVITDTGSKDETSG
ncbi:MAG: HRDC domain-containing protein [Planctomycetota bacterium]